MSLYSPGGGGTAATQAEQEAASSTTVFVTPGRQHFHPSACKAWCEFDSTGTPAILASYNTSSLTDNGTGDITVNWDTDFSSDTYCVLALSSSTLLASNDGANLTVGAARFQFAANLTGTLTDTARNFVAAFGDQ